MHLSKLDMHEPSCLHTSWPCEERGNASWKGKNAAKGRRDHIHRLYAFAINAFTPAARPDSFGHNFLVCDQNLVILNSLESLKSLVSEESGFTGFGLSV